MECKMLSKNEARTRQRLVDKCPECGSDNLVHDYDTGETVCGDCGLVLYEQMMDKGPEWRAFTQEEKASRSRVGVPTRYSVNDKVYIPAPTKEKAAVVYRKALDKGLVRGRSIAAIAAAALYAACRGSGTPRTLREIAEASLVDKKDVARCYRLLLRELDVHMPIADPLTYVSKIAESTGISGKTQGIAIQILREARKRRAAAGKDPMGLAAAALYIACLQNNEKKTQKDMAEAAGVNG